MGMSELYIRSREKSVKILQVSAMSRKRKYKIDHISKTKNHTEKVIHAKKWAPDQFKSTLQIWPVLKKVEFLGRLWCPNVRV